MAIKFSTLDERRVILIAIDGALDADQVEEMRRRGVKVTEIDADEHPELVRQYGITQLPTYIVLEDGVEVKRAGDISLIVSIVSVIETPRPPPSEPPPVPVIVMSPSTTLALVLELTKTPSFWRLPAAPVPSMSMVPSLVADSLEPE